MSRRPLRLRTPGTLLLAAILAACGPSEPRGAGPKAGSLVITASQYPLDEFARQVAGDGVEVMTLVPAGVEPHDWEPAPRDLVSLARARLLIVNGAGMEPWVSRLTPEIVSRGTRLVTTTAGLALLSAGTSGASPTAAPDPHVWLDPTLAQGQVVAIRDALAETDPPRRATYLANAEALLGRLRALDARIEEGTRACRRREMLVTHAAFAYLARRYRLTQVALLGASPDAEPSPAELAAIVRRARTTGARHVFMEPLAGRRLAETLAREIPATLLTLNPLEGLTDQDRAAGRDYVALMEANLASLRQGLDCP